MSYKFYQFGVLQDAGSGSGDIPVASDYGVPQTEAGTLGAALVTISFSSITKWLTIRNTHDSDSLQYSVDGGATWDTLGPYGATSAPLAVSSLQLRRVAGNPTYYVEAALS